MTLSTLSQQVVYPGTPMTMSLSSPGFSDGSSIPREYSCDGDDVSPELSWSGAPEGTESIALICEDPDAPRGIFAHWVLFNIPASIDSLRQEVAVTADIGGDAREGINDFGNPGYGGPCPPPGKPHRYVFRLFALDNAVLEQSGAVDRAALLNAVKGHILAEARLVGTYRR